MTTNLSTPSLTWQSGSSNAPLPPMVPGLPFVGNTLDLANDVLGFLTAQYHRMGPIFRIRVLNDIYTVIAGQDANLFMARLGNEHFRSKEFWQGMDRELGTNRSLISEDGELHARLRQLEKRGFGKSVIDGRFADMVAISRRAVEQWQPGQARPVYRWMQSLVTEQLGTLIANTAPGEYLQDVIDFVRTALLVHVTHQRPGFFAQTPAYRRAKRRSFELARQILEFHLAHPPLDRPANLIDDAIAAAAQGDLLSNQDLLPIALGPFIAGLDTASSTIAFLLYALHKHPDLLARARAEAHTLFENGLPTPDDFRRLDVLHRVTLETLRRYPIAPAVQRTVTQPFEFHGCRVEAGGRIFIGTTVAHFIPELHPQPYVFDIDRYLAPRNEHKVPGAFAPFSLGAHTCLGAGLAETQIMLVAASLLHFAEFELSPLDYDLKTRSAPTPAPGPSFQLRLVKKSV